MIEGLFGRHIPLAQLMGLVGRDLNAEQTVADLPYNERLTNSRGEIGGGAIITALDLALAAAVRAHDPEHFTVATIELTTHFVAPCRQHLSVRSRCTHRGRRICFAQGEAFDAAGVLVATACGVFSLDPH